MITSPTVNEITKALAKAQAEIKHAVKDAQNQHMKNTYATLASVIDAVKDALLKNGIVIIQSPTLKTLVTRLQHSSGEFFQNEMDLIVPKNDMQGLGSAISYGRRYSLAAMLSISQEDDDGQLASRKGPAPKVLVKPTISTTNPPKKNDSDF